MLKYSVSSIITMNVFGSSQASETKKNISNLEQSIKSYTNKIEKIEHLIEQNNKSNHVQEEQVETLQLTSTDIAERMSKIEVSLKNIRENTDGLKNIIPVILSRLNTIDTYYKDKP